MKDRPSLRLGSTWLVLIMPLKFSVFSKHEEAPKSVP